MLAFAREGRGACRPLGEAVRTTPELPAATPTPTPPLADVEPSRRSGLLRRAGVAVLDWFAPVVPAAADHQGGGGKPPASPAEGVPGLGVELNGQQRAAVGHVLASRDRVTLLRGAAGTGKTTLAREAVRRLEAAGRRVHGFAPSAEASRGVMRGEGFKDADTVARLLVDDKQQAGVAGGVLWVDEAGLLGVRTTARLFDVAQRHGCRLVLVGDARQHASVERGDALRLLEQEAGLRPAEVTAVVRRRGDYRRAVELLAAGDVAGGFDRLDRLGAVREVADAHDRHGRLVADYLDATAAGRSVLVVSPTHAEGEAVTARIRDALRERGGLGDDEREVTRLRNLNWTNWTEAQREDASGYRPGLIAVFHQNAKGFKRGERLEVVEVQPAGVLARRGDGTVAPLPLGQAARFGVFEPRTLRLAAGDLVRLTANGTDLAGRRVNNGATYRVGGFDAAGNVRLGPVAKGNKQVPITLPADHGRLAHGYVTTSHASQGRTVDRVLVAQSAESLPASDARQFYVSVSRAREGVTVYTDDAGELLRAARRDRVRPSAVELERSPDFGPAASTGDHAARRLLERLRDAARQAAERVAERAHELRDLAARRVRQRERERDADYDLGL